MLAKQASAHSDGAGPEKEVPKSCVKVAFGAVTTTTHNDNRLVMYPITPVSLKPFFLPWIILRAIATTQAAEELHATRGLIAKVNSGVS